MLLRMCGLVWAAYIFLGGILTQAVFGGDTEHGGRGCSGGIFA